MAALAYYILQQTIIRSQGPASIVKKAVGRDWKGKLSPAFYIAAIVTARFSPLLAEAMLVAVALVWLIPDRRMEQASSHKRSFGSP
jgi:hypothetical protein